MVKVLLDNDALQKTHRAIAQIIYNQAALVHSNQQKLKHLAETIHRIVSSLQGLSSLPQNQQFIESLTALQLCLTETKDMIQALSAQGKFNKFFNAGKEAKQIDGFKQCILELVPVLNIGLTAQQLIDKARDREAEQLDRNYLKVQQEALFREQQQARLSPEDLDAIVRRQMMSLEGRLIQQLQASPTHHEKRLLPKGLEVNLCDLVFSHKICDSDVGALYQGTYQAQPVTIKWIDRLETAEERMQFVREAQVMSHLHNETIIPFLGACFEERHLCIVLGVINGNLAQFMTSYQRNQQTALNISLDLARGLAYLHQNRMIHGDINPTNIGINRHNQAKWIDFGLVKTRALSIASLKATHQDIAWQAPESWQRRTHLTEASDVYSFGLLLWSLMTGNTPYEGIPAHEIITRVKAGYREPIPESLPTAYRALITACWSDNPSQRPTARDIVQHLQTIVLTPQRPVSPNGEALYEQGVAAQKSKKFEEALVLFERSCLKEYAKSYTSVGLFKLEGLGGQPRDKKGAIQYLKKAAEKGHARAMCNLGRIYEKGDTESNLCDYPEALDWYTKAAIANPKDVRAHEKVELLTTLLKDSGSTYQYETNVQYK